MGTVKDTYLNIERHGMRDTEFVAELLRLESPWVVKRSKIDLTRQRVDAHLE